MNANTRPWYFWPVIAFAVGLLIGWLLIGWLLWPVKWTNAQVQDLRPDLRYEYVAMVAESYATTRNLEQARGRLAGWPEENLAQDLAAAQEIYVARNLQTAQSVQDLAAALGVSAVPRGAGEPGQEEPSPQPQPTTAPAEEDSGAIATLRRVCTAGLFVLLAAGALALLAYLFRRWRMAAQDAPSSSTEREDEELDTVAVAEQEKTRWPARESFDDDRPSGRGGFSTPPARPYSAPSDDGGALDPSPFDRPATPLRPVGPAPIEPVRNVEPPARPPAPAPAAASANLQKMTERTAVYQMGEPDYDETFDITSPTDGFMGQFGLQLIEPFGRERDQAVALQVWLWDSTDPDTHAMVLMSEGAYRDTALRSQHAGENQAISVRPGAEFELTSHDLLMKGRVEKASYAEAEPPRTIFADLHVKLTVYRRG